MSSIEWTEKTWNPVTGCDKVSQGCKHCYADRMAQRLKGMGKKGYENGFNVALHEDRLDITLKRKKPTMWFVCSMGDLFHEKVPFSFIDQVMNIMRATPQHTYQVLTKRPTRMRDYCNSHHIEMLPKNMWMGVSVENIHQGVPRIDILRNIESKITIRFLSVEPLLKDIGNINLKGIDWVIVGGESGPGARPMKSEWVDNVHRQCKASGTLFFFKQWGIYGEDGVKRTKKANGRYYKGLHWDEMPILTQVKCPY